MNRTPFRIDHKIQGRSYHIEVSFVAVDKWRAQVVTSYGGPTALMPFYGPTPEMATAGLTAWLTRAHANANERLA